MRNERFDPTAPFLAALTPSEYGALVALATRGPESAEQSRRSSASAPATTAYVEHCLVLRGLAIRIAGVSDDQRTVLVLSTAGRLLVNDVRERDRDQSHTRRRPGAHDFGDWPLRSPRRLSRDRNPIQETC